MAKTRRIDGMLKAREEAAAAKYEVDRKEQKHQELLEKVRKLREKWDLRDEAQAREKAAKAQQEQKRKEQKEALFRAKLQAFKEKSAARDGMRRCAVEAAARAHAWQEARHRRGTEAEHFIESETIEHSTEAMEAQVVADDDGDESVQEGVVAQDEGESENEGMLTRMVMKATAFASGLWAKGVEWVKKMWP